MTREVTWRRYLRFWKPDVDADIDDEVRFHLEERVEALMAQGFDRAAARHQAESEFGDVRLVRQRLSEIDRRVAAGKTVRERWDRVRQDIVYSARSLMRSRGLALTIVATLALGIGANATLFTVIDRVFLRMPGGVARPDGVRRVYWMGRGPNGVRTAIAHFSIPIFRALRASQDSTSPITVYRYESLPVGDAEANRESAPTAVVEFVGPDYFRLLGVTPASGRFFVAEEERVDVPQAVAVVSQAFWRNRLGGAPDVVGQRITVGKRHHTIIGITPPGFTGPDLDAVDVWLPYGSYDGPGGAEAGHPPWYEGRNLFAFLALARLSPAADARTFEARATAQLRPTFGERPWRDTLVSVATGPLIAARGPERQDHEVAISARLGGVAIVVLLIACANVANLLLARGVQRRREIAVRTALGGPRSVIIRLLLAESLLLALVAGIAALMVAGVGGTLLRTLLFPDVHWGDSALDWRVAGFTLGVTLLAGIAAGLVPALQCSRSDVSSTLKAGAREGTVQRSRLRSTLMIAQSALSVTLLVGAALFVRSLHNVRGLDLGFDSERLVFVSVDLEGGSVKGNEALRAARLPQLAERLGQVPGVERVALASTTPMWSFSFNAAFYQNGDSLPRAADGLPGSAGVSPDFFAAAGLRVLRGRGFESSDPRGSGGVLVVNEALARSAWPNEDAIGKCLRLATPTSPCATVVGVVENSRRSDVVEQVVRQFYVPATDTGFYAAGTAIVRVSPERAAAIEAAARREGTALFPGAEIRVRRMGVVLAPQYRPWRLGASLFTVFGLLALLVAMVGVYGTVSNAVGQRRHEFGVRVALGARAEDVVALVVGHGVRAVAAGVVLGALLALAAGRLIASLLYGVSPRDPFVLAAVSVVLLVVAAVASLVPAWRASRVDPVEALRAE